MFGPEIIAGPLVGGALWDLRDRAPFILSIVIEGILALLYPIAIIILARNIDIDNKKTEENSS